MDFFLFVAGWNVLVLAKSGVIAGGLMLILGADILIAGLLAKNLEQRDAPYP